MNELKKREKALEEKYFLDFEMVFKVRSRRDRLLGEWAAAEIGIADADGYIAEIIDARITRGADTGVIEKIISDGKARGKVFDENALQEKMRALMLIAAEQLETENRRGSSLLQGSLRPGEYH